MNHVQKRFSNWILVSMLVLVAGGAAPLGQQRSLGGPAGDVLVDFIAVGANGQPVADLQASDVSIKIAGKARTISSLELKKAGSGGGAAASSLPAPFATNEAKAGGRSFLIVIDSESLRPGNERGIRESLEALFKSLGSADRVGFSIAPRDTARVGLGGGLPAVRDALAKFTANKSSATGTTATNEAICRTSETLQLVRSMIDALGPSDTPTNVLFFAASLSLPSKTSSSAAQQCEVPTDYYRVLGASVATSRVNMYVVQGDDTIAGRDDGLENLAGVTSAGSVLRTTGAGLGRVIAESSAYYVATVKPEPDDRAGQTQRLELKVNREAVSTRSRSDVALVRGGAAGAGAKAGSATDMIRTTTAFSDLQLRATYVASRGPGGKMVVLTMTEPVDPSVKFKELMVAVIDTSVTPNKIVFPSKADEKQLVARPVTIPVSTDPGGKYRVRVAAIDETGKAGAVDYDLVTDLTPAGPIKMGGMLVAGPRGQGYAPQLLFTNEEEIALSMEIYGELTAQLSAKFEIAASESGPALAEGPAGGNQTTDKDRFVLQSKIPIGKLPPGDYVIRAIVQMQGQPEGRVYRTLRKVAK